MKKSPFVIALAAALLAACASTPAPVVSPSSTATTPAASAPANPGVATVDVTGSTATPPAGTLANGDLAAAVKAAPDARSAQALLNGHSVYFDYDQSVVKDDQRGVVEGNAALLNRFHGKVLVQGNTDARGSREYNLALGQRRAESVKQSLEVLGVKANQVEAVSFGKEKPRAEGDSDAANAENRRADFVYPQ